MTTSTTATPVEPVALTGPRPIVLREWAPWTVPLTLSEASRLARQASDFLEVDIDRRGSIVVRPQSHVGRFRTEDFDVRIDPKVPVECLLTMLGEAYDLVDFRSSVHVGEQDRLEDLLVRAFLAEVQALLSVGLHRVYQELDDELSAVRGRVQTRATHALFLRGVPRVACRFEEFTLNTPENQVVLAALQAVAGSSVLQRRHRLGARQLAGDLSDVEVPRDRSLEALLQSIPRLGLDVRTRHYRRTLGLADLILRAMGAHERHGRWRSTGFLVDMNQLFETVLTKRLTHALRPRGLDVQRQVRSTLDFGGEVQIRPDMIVRDHAGRAVVVDAKYKSAAAQPADMYQMVAYCRALGVTDAVLIDVAGGPERRYGVRDGVVSIHTLHVDLSTVESLAASVGRAAERLMALVGGATA